MTPGRQRLYIVSILLAMSLILSGIPRFKFTGLHKADAQSTGSSNISLLGVTTDGCNATVSYSQQTTACVHLLRADTAQILHTQNLFCDASGTVTLPLTGFQNGFQSGLQVKLCHGNNYNECSATVTITGSGLCQASSASSSYSSMSSSSSSALSAGCIEVINETFDASSNPLRPVPPWNFRLDGGTGRQNDAAGLLRFENVGIGYHTVTEDMPASWELVAATPPGGTVFVAGGSNCAAVLFKNRQLDAVFTSSASSLWSSSLSSSIASSFSSMMSSMSSSVSSSSSSSSSFPSSSFSSSQSFGCIEVVKEAFDSDDDPLSSVPQFSFKVDGSVQGWNNADGRTMFMNVPAGSHTITEEYRSDWDQLSVSPANGVVTVYGGNACASVTFRNKQHAPMQAQQSAPIYITNTNTNVNVAVPGGNSSSLASYIQSILQGNPANTASNAYARTDTADGISVTNTNVNTNIAVGGEETRPREPLDLSVSKTADRTEAVPGDTVWYSVTVFNPAGEALRNVQVNDMFSDAQLTVEDAGGGNLFSNRLQWSFGSLGPSETQSIRYSARLSPDVMRGTIVRNTVFARADGVPDRMAQNEVSILQAPPQTGVELFGAPSKPSMPTPSAAEDDLPAPFWASIVMMGIGTGGFITRRFFELQVS